MYEMLLTGIGVYLILILCYDYSQTMYHEQAHKRVFERFGIKSEISYWKRHTRTLTEVSEKDKKEMMPYHIQIDNIGYNVYAIGQLLCTCTAVLVAVVIYF